MEPASHTPPSKKKQRDWISLVLGGCAILLVVMLWLDSQAESQMRAHGVLAKELEAKIHASLPALAPCQVHPVGEADFLLACPTNLDINEIQSALVSHLQTPPSLIASGKLSLRQGRTTRQIYPVAGKANNVGDKAFFQEARRRQVRRE